ncbi:hypothetical protein CHR48_00635 [Weissella cibaria]|nr:hypothetical protein AUC63_01450 [Weissella cibaria]APU62847.1 hypothetical protein AUC65_01056 [Weissella cibaria]APU64998.1 hypothetical protein AUC62_01049 [Weissella cibaria]ASS51626.1 hypothetical protein CHR48_00635 [Weissella cibaria]
MKVSNFNNTFDATYSNLFSTIKKTDEGDIAYNLSNSNT